MKEREKERRKSEQRPERCVLARPGMIDNDPQGKKLRKVVSSEI